jgi:hypothetical protein
MDEHPIMRALSWRVKRAVIDHPYSLHILTCSFGKR